MDATQKSTEQIFQILASTMSEQKQKQKGCGNVSQVFDKMQAKEAEPFIIESSSLCDGQDPAETETEQKHAMENDIKATIMDDAYGKNIYPVYTLEEACFMPKTKLESIEPPLKCYAETVKSGPNNGVMILHFKGHKMFEKMLELQHCVNHSSGDKLLSRGAEKFSKCESKGVRIHWLNQYQSLKSYLNMDKTKIWEELNLKQRLLQNRMQIPDELRKRTTIYYDMGWRVDQYQLRNIGNLDQSLLPLSRVSSLKTKLLQFLLEVSVGQEKESASLAFEDANVEAKKGKELLADSEKQNSNQWIMQETLKVEPFDIARTTLSLELTAFIHETNQRRASLSVGSPCEMVDSRQSFLDGLAAVVTSKTVPSKKAQAILMSRTYSSAGNFESSINQPLKLAENFVAAKHALKQTSSNLEWQKALLELLDGDPDAGGLKIEESPSFEMKTYGSAAHSSTNTTYSVDASKNDNQGFEQQSLYGSSSRGLWNKILQTNCGQELQLESGMSTHQIYDTNIALHFTNSVHVSTRVVDPCNDSTLPLQVTILSQVNATLNVSEAWLNLQDGFVHIGQSDGRSISAFLPVKISLNSGARLAFHVGFGRGTTEDENKLQPESLLKVTCRNYGDMNSGAHSPSNDSEGYSEFHLSKCYNLAAANPRSMRRRESKIPQNNDEGLSEVKVKSDKPPTMLWQATLAFKRNLQLAACFYMHLKITEKIGEVTSKLDLLDHVQIHLFFRENWLKRKFGERAVAATEPSQVINDGQWKVFLEMFLDKWIVKKCVCTITQLIVRWTNFNFGHNNWEICIVFRARVPNFDPWGQGSTHGGGNVMHKRKSREEEVRLEERNLGITKEGLGIANDSDDNDYNLDDNDYNPDGSETGKNGQGEESSSDQYDFTSPSEELKEPASGEDGAVVSMKRNNDSSSDDEDWTDDAAAPRKRLKRTAESASTLSNGNASEKGVAT
ncbi:hypothetical protein F3Y22_tig00110339pilonHSYRG00038 [Hibiscus syriacus]|uniref:Uncharacterized protein n=1 Tax=Hibiscus syriacus TaxID=106335 RepID=A0A6A3AXH1_HIBSY|nr:hypothetical protein F3Y22_tig00110339pilonHSYRG00038 [Hibiscus syriacus]